MGIGKYTNKITLINTKCSKYVSADYLFSQLLTFIEKNDMSYSCPLRSRQTDKTDRPRLRHREQILYATI